MNSEFPSDIFQDAPDEWDGEQVHGLSSALDKMVEFGQLVGVGPEEMIALLESGMTVRGLLYYLVSQSSPVN